MQSQSQGPRTERIFTEQVTPSRSLYVVLGFAHRTPIGWIAFRIWFTNRALKHEHVLTPVSSLSVSARAVVLVNRIHVCVHVLLGSLGHLRRERSAVHVRPPLNSIPTLALISSPRDPTGFGSSSSSPLIARPPFSRLSPFTAYRWRLGSRSCSSSCASASGSLGQQQSRARGSASLVRARARRCPTGVGRTLI